MKKKLRLSAAIFTLSLFVLFGSFIQPQLHNSYLRYEVGDSVVQVLVGEGGGTGFAIEGGSGTQYIVTNKHVCEASKNGWVKIKRDDGLSAFKKILYKDKKHDLCLVEGDKRLSPLDMGGRPNKGDYHYIVGHPGLRQLTVSKGEYIGFDNVELALPSKTKESCSGQSFELSEFEQLVYGAKFVCVYNYLSYGSSAIAHGGNSGSPVVNKYGNVIGVLFAGSQQAGDSYLVPGYEVERVLNNF